jgi:hypothetical protein
MLEHEGVRKRKRRRSRSKRRLRERQKSEFLRNYGIQSCLVLVLFSSILAWFLTTRTPQAPPLPLDDVQSSQEHIDEVKKLLQQVRLDGHLRKRHPFEIALKDKELGIGLTTEGAAQELLRSRRIEIPNLKIRNGVIQVAVSAPISGRTIHINMGFVPVLSDGSLSFQVKSSTVEAGGVSDTEANAVVSDVAKALDEKAFDNNVNYESVKIEGDMLVMRGNTR